MFNLKKIKKVLKKNKAIVSAISAFAVISIVVIISLLSYSKKIKNEEIDKINLTVTIQPIEMFAKQVGGEYVSINTSTPEGVNPFEFVPDEEVQQYVLNNSDVFVYNGINLIDSWANNLAKDLTKNETIVNKLSNNISLIFLKEVQNNSASITKSGDKISYSFYIDLPNPCYQVQKDFAEKEGELTITLQTISNSEELCAQVIQTDLVEGQVDTTEDIESVKIILNDELFAQKSFDETITAEKYDPYIWLDPVLAKVQVNLIKNSLISAAPQYKDKFEKNAEEYSQELGDLNQKYLNLLSNCEKSTIAVTENSFGYLANRYDLETLVLSDIYDKNGSISLEKISKIGQIARENQVQYIYFSETPSQEVQQALGQDITPLTLNSMIDSNQASYIKTMEENLANITASLSCQN